MQSKKRETHSGRRKALLWVLALMCAAVWFPVSARADGTKLVRVGMYKKAGDYNVDESGRYSGYDYDYLQKIAFYTGWKYEFVEGTWDECISMLESGRIDLLGNVTKNARREKVMQFANVATMCSANCLLSLAEDNSYTYEDFESFNGMRVGLVRGTAINSELYRFSKERDFSYLKAWYDTEEEVLEALKSGEIDTACMGSNRNLNPYKVLAYFGYSKRYYAVSNQRRDLLDELNDALQQIWVIEPTFESHLYGRYFETNHSIALTKEEQHYIDHMKPIQVGLYLDISKLICRYDKKEERFVGIMPDILDEITERTGLRFAYEAIPEDETPSEYMKKRPGAIIAPALLNSLVGGETDFRTLEPAVQGRMLTVAKSGRQIGLDDAFTLAVPDGMYVDAAQLKRVFTNAIIISGGTHRGGLEMVANGEADMALVNEITAAYQMQSPYFADLQTIELTDITEDLTFGLSFYANPELVSILNKAIFSLTERDIRQIVVENTAAISYEMTLGEWFYDKRYLFVIIFLIAVGSVFYVDQRNKYKNEKAEVRQQFLVTQERLKVEEEYHQKLFRQANFDGMTGIYNENYFVIKANERLLLDTDTDYTFIRINLKNFKMLNDLYGIDAGDEVLMHIADRLRKDVGAGGVFGRLYADQFIVCKRIRRLELESGLSVRNLEFETSRGQKIHYKISLGVYVDERHCRSAVKALDYTQIALANEKGSGDVVITYFQDSYLEEMRRKQKITNEMERALAEEQFQVYLQPQFDVNGLKIIGAEALVRWLHPKYGMVSPAQFIPVFEQNRFIYRLDSYMCDKVCALLARWLADGRAVPVSVNLSQIDMENPDLIPMLLGALERHRVPARYLHLEITESAYAEDRRLAKHVIERLRELGFCVEMDDFGCGYSSLNMLKDVPVDVLKMDMQFLDEETHMDRGGKIISAVVEMAHSMGILVIAEGVETEREANFLQSVGCNFAQGYLYSHPIPTEEFSALLQEREIGEKQIGVHVNAATERLYWKMQMYEMVLRNERLLLFDYDPELDQAVCTYTDADGAHQEVLLNRYAKTLGENRRVHPEDRMRLCQYLDGADRTRTVLKFRGDRFGTGTYEPLYADIYYYGRNEMHRRTLAIIKEDAE